MQKKIYLYTAVFVASFLLGFCLSECRGRARLDELENTLLSATENSTKLRAAINDSEIRIAELKRQYKSDIERERERIRKQIAIIESIGTGLTDSEGILREFGETTENGLEIIEKIEKRNALQ